MTRFDPKEKDPEMIRFRLRWEKIGLPPAKPAVSRPSSSGAGKSEGSRPSSAASAPGKQHSSSRTFLTNVSSSLKLGGKVQRKAALKKTLRDRACEAGDPCRLLTTSVSDPSLICKNPDFLEHVAHGLRHHDHEARQPRRSRVGFSLLRADIDASGCSQPTPIFADSMEDAHDASVQVQLREAWGVTTKNPGQSGALNDMISPEGRAKRRMSRGRPATLKDFKMWCIKTFGSVDAAWSAVDAESRGSVARDDFVTAVGTLGFPMGELGGRTIFFFLDAGDNEELTKEALLDELAKVPLDTTTTMPNGDAWAADARAAGSRGSYSANDSAYRSRSCSSVSADTGITKQTPSMDMGFDTIEAHALGLLKPDANVDLQRSKKLEDLRDKDAVMAQLLEFMYTAFGTLKAAFRHMDINGNGQLSKSEFMDSMLHGVRSNVGMQAVDDHIHDLFKRADHRGSGALHLTELLDELETGDPLLDRLAQFFMHTAIHVRAVGVTPGHQAQPDQAPRRERLERAFRAMGLGSGKAELITRTGFAALLTQLQYQDWHVGDLFRRMDLDGSGEITLRELTAWLMPQLPVQKPKPTRVAPLGSEERRKKVEGPRSALMTSKKIERIGHGRTRAKSHNKTLRPSSSAGDVTFAVGSTDSADVAAQQRSLNGWWIDRGVVRIDRPDFPGIIRDSLSSSKCARSGHSQMLQHGHQMFSRCPDIGDDASLNISGALEEFNLEVSRDRTEGMARTEHWQ